MKKIAMFSLVMMMAFFCTQVYSQQKATVKADYNKTIKVKGAKASELGKKVDYWLKSFFSNNDNLILKKEYIDKYLVITASSLLSDKTTKVSYKISFLWADGEYTYMINNLGTPETNNTEVQALLKNISQRIERTMVSIIPE